MIPNTIYTRPIWLDSDQETLKVIDQRLLPHSVVVLNLKTADDVIMAIGDMVVRGCLLYTSPSPRDGLLSRMPSSA